MDSVSKLARQIARLDGRMRKMESKPQLANSSIENGSVDVYNGEGNLSAVVGKQWDGSYGAVPVTGPTPPTPSAPAVTGGQASITVVWDGTYQGEDVHAPLDFHSVEVYAAPGNFSARSDAVLIGSFSNESGGSITVYRPVGEWTVRLITKSAPGIRSDLSEAATGSASSVVDPALLDELEERLTGLGDDLERLEDTDLPALVADLETLTGTTLPALADEMSTLEGVVGALPADIKAAQDAADAARAEADKKADQDWVLSRGTDLVTNGTGYLGDNTNFSGFAFEPNDAPVGARGSFRLDSNGFRPGSRLSDESIPVDATRKYLLSVMAREAGTVGGRAYVGLVPYDSAGYQVVPQTYRYSAPTVTTLAASLNPGDTSASVAAITGTWLSSAFSYLGVWDWTDQYGKTWPSGTYTRDYPRIDRIEGTTIYFSAPYTGGSRPAGTPVSNNSAGSTYMYAAMNSTLVPAEWTRFTGVVSGVQDGALGLATTSFPPGTAYVRLLFMANYNAVENSSQRFAAISFSDATAALAEAEEARVRADAAQEKADALEGQVGTLQTELTAAEGRIDTVQNTTLPALQSDLGTLRDTTIPNLQDTVGALPADIEAAKEAAQEAAEQAEQLWASTQTYNNPLTSTDGLYIFNGPATSEVVEDSPLGHVLRKSGTGNGWWWSARPILFDPEKLYRVSVTVRAVVDATNISASLYAGITGLKADGTLVNAAGDTTTSGQHYIAAERLPVVAADGWVTVTGYLRGHGTTSGDRNVHSDPENPSVLHPSATHFSPLVILDYNGGNGVWEIGRWTVDALSGTEADRIVAAQTKADAAQSKADALEGTVGTLQTALTANETAVGNLRDVTLPGLTERLEDTEFDIRNFNAEWITAGQIDTALLNTVAVAAAIATVIELNAGQITSGTVDTERLNATEIAAAVATVIQLNADRITSGTIKAGQIDTTGLAVALADIIELNAGQITSGTVSTERLDAGSIAAAVANVISLNASSITSGTINTARLNVDAIAAGVANIITINASQITTGELGANRIAVNELFTALFVANKITADHADLGSFAADDGFVASLRTATLTVGGPWQSGDIGSLPASKISSGTLADARIPSLAQSKISGLPAKLTAHDNTTSRVNTWTATGKTTIDGGRIETDSIKAGAIDVESLVAQIAYADAFYGKEFYGGTFRGTSFIGNLEVEAEVATLLDHKGVFVQPYRYKPVAGGTAHWQPATSGYQEGVIGHTAHGAWGTTPLLDDLSPLSIRGPVDLTQPTFSNAPAGMQFHANGEVRVRSKGEVFTLEKPVPFARTTATVGGESGFYGDAERYTTRAPNGLVTFEGSLQRTASDLSLGGSWVYIGNIAAGYRPRNSILMSGSTSSRQPIQMSIGTDGRISIRSIGEPSTVPVDNGNTISLNQIPPYYAGD